MISSIVQWCSTILGIGKTQQDSYRNCDLPKKWNHVYEALCPTIFDKKSRQKWCWLFQHRNGLMLTSVGSQWGFFLFHFEWYWDTNTRPKQAKGLNGRFSSSQFFPGVIMVLNNLCPSTDLAVVPNVPDALKCVW